MADLTFNTPAGNAIARELLVAALNTGTAEAPVWSPVGRRVEDSSASFDWGIESSKDIFGATRTKGKKPVITQTFEPWTLDAEDKAQQKIWNLAIKDQDVGALMAQDMLIVHLYAGESGKFFAERYKACSVLPTDLGGEGGAFVGMSIEVTYGGDRVTGTVEVDNGEFTFTPEVSV